MTTQAEPATLQPLRLRSRQILAIVRLEILRHLLSSANVWVLFLAFSPAAIAGAHSAFGWGQGRDCSIEQDSTRIAWIFQLFYVRLAFFFGTLATFVRLLRGELVDQTLHYYLLIPLRREAMVVAKFLAGAIGVATLFTLGWTSCFVLMYLHHGAHATDFVLHGQGGGQLLAYVAITWLACLGYGSTFLAFGLIFRNPVLPAVLYLGWETISAMLPATLQYLSVSFYLKALFPVQLPLVGLSGLFTVMVEPIAGWIAVLGVLLFCCVVVTLASLYGRRLEIEQAGE